MKKHLIAAAVAAAVAVPAMAQNVTLSGNLDFAYGNIKKDGQAAENTFGTTGIVSSTSVINIRAVEDLGGGMKATVHLGIDPRAWAQDNGTGTTTFNRDELYVGVEAGFGNLRVGAPNSIGLTTLLAGNPFGTNVGGGYAVLDLDHSTVRYDRSARYDSPNINGFTFSALHAPGADAAATQLIGQTQAISATAAGANTLIPAAGAATEFGLSYANGPLTVAFANIEQAKYLTSVKTSSNILSANYKLGSSTTLYAGWNDGDSKFRGTSTTASKGSRVAVKQNLGAIDVIAGYAEQKNEAVKETVLGLRADYNLSKSSAAYAAYESYDNGAATNANRTIMSVGLRKAF